ncbi:hypothetical protein A5482_014640 (plasmid) [Cyanobacterium sp. IPPAS B-1200]|uniref:hypothetical protein n=1 Tax=Cyanobacterium sp. IPPAS B-1200 TaxID=1562720 RepID=UPI0008524ECE|nr:hypothetical protein [Cyanobacterium sp. IPPAS B-1200]OEJ77887.1 hypothetical protein A5482_14770 [Cyanobacterium sp. IPPAS B-1200]
MIKKILPGISLLSIALPVTANPMIVAQSNCQATVNGVIREINRKGVTTVNQRVLQGTANENNYGNPTDRTDEISIVMGNHNSSNNERHRIADILYSAVLMNSWANTIVKECGSTAVVSFGLNFSGWNMSYAIQADGKTTPRDCREPGYSTRRLAWNEMYCT